MKRKEQVKCAFKSRNIFTSLHYLRFIKIKSYNVIFNNKKTVCIKFGNEVIRNEAAFLNNQPLKWNEKVRHLGNIIDKDCTELADCVFKKSMCIGYVNKLRSNFRHLQTHVLITLFKAYCCSFHGSIAAMEIELRWN